MTCIMCIYIYIYVHWPPIFGHRSLKTFRPAMARCSMLSVLLLHIIEMHLGPLAIEWWGIMWQHLVWSGLTCSMFFLPWNSETEFNRSRDRSPRHSKTKKLPIPKLPSYSCNLWTGSASRTRPTRPTSCWRPLFAIGNILAYALYAACAASTFPRYGPFAVWIWFRTLSCDWWSFWFRQLYVVIHIFLSSKRKGDMQTFGIVSTSSWAALMSSSFLGPSTAPSEGRLGFLEPALKLPKSCIQRCVIL